MNKETAEQYQIQIYSTVDSGTRKQEVVTKWNTNLKREYSKKIYADRIALPIEQTI